MADAVAGAHEFHAGTMGKLVGVFHGSGAAGDVNLTVKGVGDVGFIAAVRWRRNLKRLCHPERQRLKRHGISEPAPNSQA